MTLDELTAWAAHAEARLQRFAAILESQGHDVLVENEVLAEKIVTPAARAEIVRVETPAAPVVAQTPAADPANPPEPPPAPATQHDPGVVADPKTPVDPPAVRPTDITQPPAQG